MEILTLNKLLNGLSISVSTAFICLIVLYIPYLDFTIKRYLIPILIVVGSLCYIWCISKK